MTNGDVACHFSLPLSALSFIVLPRRLCHCTRYSTRYSASYNCTSFTTQGKADKPAVTMLLEEVAGELSRRQGPVMAIGCAVDGSSISDVALGAALNVTNVKR